jgi:hypothetical protein
MVKRGKNINMFLMDDEVTGKIKCTLSNWTGVIYKIPRIQLGDLKSRPEMKQSGVYFYLVVMMLISRIQFILVKQRAERMAKVFCYVFKSILGIIMLIISMMSLY